MWGKKMVEEFKLFSAHSDYTGPVLSDLSHVHNKWSELNLRLAPVKTHYCLYICDYVKKTLACLPLTWCVKQCHNSFLNLTVVFK